MRRFDRDVLAQTGATHVIVLLGTNDIRNRRGLPEEMVSADDMIAGLAQLAARGSAREASAAKKQGDKAATQADRDRKAQPKEARRAKAAKGERRR